MQTLRACACALLCTCLVSLSSAQVTKSWSAYRDLNRYGNEEAGSIARSSDGGYYALSADKTNSILRKFDTSGAVLWKRGIPGARLATNTALLSNGTGVVIATSVMTSGVNWIMASKFDTTGHQLWTSRLSPKLYTGMGQAIFDPSGNVVISGGGAGPGYSDGLLAKLNSSTGAVMFQTSYGTPNLSDSIEQIKTDSAGNILAIARSQDLTQAFNPPPTMHLLKFSPAGALLWSQDFAGTHGVTHAVDATGNTYLVALVEGDAPTSAILKISPSGANVWTKPLPLAGDAIAAFTTGGNLILAGGDADTKITLSQVTPSGAITTIGTTPGGLRGSTDCMVLDGSNNVYLGALFDNSPSDKPVLHKFNLTTGLVWSRFETGSFGTNNLSSNPSSVLIDGSGHIIYLSTVSNVSPTLLDTRISSYDSAGNKLWSDDNDPQMTADNAAASVTDSSGNTYVVDYDANCKVTKFDSNGQYAWAHTLMDLAPDGPVLSPEMSINGNVVVPVRYIKFSGEIGAIFYYNPAGSLLWKYSLTSSNDILREFHTASDGSIYLALEHFANGLGNLRLVHLSTSGTVLWTTNEVAIPNRHVFNMVVDGSGSTFVTYGSQGANLILAKLNSAGVPQWRKQLMGSEFGYSSRLKLDPAGNLLLLAARQMAHTDMVIKVNPNANVLWSRPITISGVSNELSAFTVDILGNTFVAGWDSASTRVQKISPAGVISWTSDYPWTDFSNWWLDMLPDQSGGVFVARNANSKNGSDYQLYKVAADGSLPWPASGGIFVNGSIRYDSRGLDDIACRLATDGHGNLFITGTSYGASGTQDVNVVKYALQP